MQAGDDYTPTRVCAARDPVYPRETLGRLLQDQELWVRMYAAMALGWKESRVMAIFWQDGRTVGDV